LGGVVSPGAELMDIVPTEENLVIEARVSPLEIDTVRPEMEAEVTLIAYPRQTTPKLSGRVDHISADVKQDSDGGTPHYAVRVIVDAGAIAALPSSITLYPGMPTETVIKAGDRTGLSYLVEPILSSVQRSFIAP
ncbi:MAG: HlyD family efflux transporter periplasmic adaptor subunit, partial [Pseudomonadota bacterium]